MEAASFLNAAEASFTEERELLIGGGGKERKKSTAGCEEGWLRQGAPWIQKSPEHLPLLGRCEQVRRRAQADPAGPQLGVGLAGSAKLLSELPRHQ